MASLERLTILVSQTGVCLTESDSCTYMFSRIFTWSTDQNNCLVRFFKIQQVLIKKKKKKRNWTYKTVNASHQRVTELWGDDQIPIVLKTKMPSPEQVESGSENYSAFGSGLSSVIKGQTPPYTLLFMFILSSFMLRVFMLTTHRILLICFRHGFSMHPSLTSDPQSSCFCLQDAGLQIRP